MESNDISIFDDIQMRKPALWKRIVCIGWIVLWQLTYLLVAVFLARLAAKIDANQLYLVGFISYGLYGLAAILGLIIRRKFGWIVATLLFSFYIGGGLITVLDGSLSSTPVLSLLFATIGFSGLLMLNNKILRQFYKIPLHQSLGKLYGLALVIAIIMAGITWYSVAATF